MIVYSWLRAILQREALGAPICPFCQNGYPTCRRNDSQPSSLTTMDRFYLAIIVSALLLLLGATGIFVTRSADVMPHARTVGVAGSR